MKKIAFLILLVACSIACTNEEAENLDITTDQLHIAQLLNPEVGGKISNENAKKWTEQYKITHTSALQVSSFCANKDLIKSLLAIQIDGQWVDGINFTSGLLEDQTETMFIAPMKDGVSLFAVDDSPLDRNDKGTLYQLAENNEAMPVTFEAAKAAAIHYRKNNDISVLHPRSYFIGRETLLEMLTLNNEQSPMTGLRFSKAIKDDQTGTLIVIPMQRSTDVWRARSADGQIDDVTYDFSKPCPNACPESDL